MQLTEIKKITGRIVLQSGLHIGGGDTEMRIGGIDNQVVKNPLTGMPYIPGSSLKGKVRSLLEWQLGLVMAANGQPFSFKHLKPGTDHADAKNLIRLFGGAPGGEVEHLAKEIGPTRLSFWDAQLNPEWKASALEERNLMPTEAKSENMIDRIKGVAENPRYTERVIAGAEFDFRLNLKVIDREELLDLVLTGLKLLENDSLGGSGSRGYGKVRFLGLSLDGEPIQERFDRIEPFTKAA